MVQRRHPGQTVIHPQNRPDSPGDGRLEERGNVNTERPGQPVIERNEKWLRPDQVRGESQQPRAFAERLADEFQLTAGQVPDAAVDQLGGPAAGPAGEVRLLDEPDPIAACGRIQRHPGTGDPAADHQHVQRPAKSGELLVAREHCVLQRLRSRF